MQLSLWPLVYAVFLWWFSTGLILYLDGLPRYTFKFTMGSATAICALGLFGLAVSSAHTTEGAAYCAFTCALLVWAWQEIAFLLGWVTGPRRTACPPDLRGMAKAKAALQTVLHHEVALLLLGGAVLAVTWNQPNRTGWWTFAVLWAMRQSAKINVFLGVRNLSDSFLPPHLEYLSSYFSRRAMNPMLPVSVVGASLVLASGLQPLLGNSAEPFEIASRSLVGSLLGLAIVEHVFLVLPLRIEGLWKWALRWRHHPET